MEQFDLADVVVLVRDGVIVIRHKKTGTETELPPGRFNSWCLRLLREEMAPQKVK